jgi:hypothetical protein
MGFLPIPHEKYPTESPSPNPPRRIPLSGFSCRILPGPIPSSERLLETFGNPSLLSVLPVRTGSVVESPSIQVSGRGSFGDRGFLTAPLALLLVWGVLRIHRLIVCFAQPCVNEGAREVGWHRCVETHEERVVAQGFP